MPRVASVWLWRGSSLDLLRHRWVVEVVHYSSAWAKTAQLLAIAYGLLLIQCMRPLGEEGAMRSTGFGGGGRRRMGVERLRGGLSGVC